MRWSDEGTAKSKSSAFWALGLLSLSDGGATTCSIVIRSHRRQSTALAFDPRMRKKAIQKRVRIPRPSWEIWHVPLPE